MRMGYVRGEDRAESRPGSASPLDASSSGQQQPLWRAAPARPPAATAVLERAREAHRRYRSEREGLEQSSIARGLLWLAVAALLVSIARAGLDRVFVHGWWNQW